MSRVTVAVLQTATLPSCLEIISTGEGPVRWEGRLSPGLIAPIPNADGGDQDIRAEARWHATLRMLAPPPYGSGNNDGLRQLFSKLDAEYDDWLFAHLEAQINALMSLPDIAPRMARPDLIVLPEYSVTARVAARLSELAVTARVNLIAGTHAWWTREWSNYPLRQYVDSTLAAAVDKVSNDIEGYISLCPIFLPQKEGLRVIVIPKLLPSTYEPHLVSPYINRFSISLETSTASAKLALFICSEFIRGPVSDDPAERRSWDSIVNDQADAGLIAVPAYTPRTELFKYDLGSHYARQKNAQNVFALANSAAFGNSIIATRDGFKAVNSSADSLLDRFAEAAIVRTVDVREGDKRSLLPSLGPEHVVYFAAQSDWLMHATDELQHAQASAIEDRSESVCPAYRTLARELARKIQQGANFARNRILWISIPQNKILALKIRELLIELRESIQHDRTLGEITSVITRQAQHIADYWGVSEAPRSIVVEGQVAPHWLWPRRRVQPNVPQRRPWPLSIASAYGLDRRKQVIICCGLPAEAIKTELQMAEQYLQECGGLLKCGRRRWTVGHPSLVNSTGVVWELDGEILKRLSRDDFSGIVEHCLDRANPRDDGVGTALMIALPTNASDEAFKLTQLLDDSGCCVRAGARVSIAVVGNASATSADLGPVLGTEVLAKNERELFDTVSQFRMNVLSPHDMHRLENGSSSRRKAFLAWLCSETGRDREFMANADVADIRVALIAGLFGVPGRPQQPNEVRRCVDLVASTRQNPDLRLALRSLPVSLDLVKALLNGDPLDRAVVGLVTTREMAMTPPLGFAAPIEHWSGV